MIKTKSGFTIVELLIVIVVIGILATIGVVSYNGAQNRARTAAAIDGADKASDLLEVFQLNNGGQYPATGSLSSAGVTDSDNVTYQYTQTSGGANYCLTATSKNVSYKISQDVRPTKGACTGHTLNGMANITNLSTNPRATAAGTGWSSNNGTIWTATRGVAISGHPEGITTAVRSQLVTGQTNSYIMSLYNADTLGNSTTSRSLGVWVYANVAATACVGAGGCSDYTNVNANTWTYIRSSSARTGWGALYVTKVGGNVTTSDLAYATGMIAVTDSAAPAFADGNSEGWVWNGTVNNSTSTGPPF